MPQLVTIGKGSRTHLRADGTGPVPAGRARCEIDQDGNYAPHYALSSGDESAAYAAPPGQPTCLWCQTRTLPN
jgi:hypothetical protein